MVETGEWFYHGKFYDEYPSEEVWADHNTWEEHQERKYERMREEGEI